MRSPLGRAWLSAVLHRAGVPAVIVLAAHGSVAEAAEVMRGPNGVLDYLIKPVADSAIQKSVAGALRRQRLFTDGGPASTGMPIGHLLGDHPSMTELQGLVETVADARSTLLIVGESGTGKSMLARAIHARSPRRDRPFVEVSCGSLPETLLESELFGHVRGAFTGAIASKPGRFEKAADGTIFLDEINSATPLMQVKLLRVLQEHAFEPVGSNETRTSDARAILATNADLEALVAAGTFRQDLFYRVNVVALRLPPLRERLSDVPLLAGHFLEKFRRESGRHILGFSGDALAALQRHAWPGNVRELENAVERAVVLCHRPTLEVSDLPESIRSPQAKRSPVIVAAASSLLPPMPLEAALQAPERQIIEAALERNAWCRIATARELGIERTTLYKKMRKHGLGRREAA